MTRPEGLLAGAAWDEREAILKHLRKHADELYHCWVRQPLHASVLTLHVSAALHQQADAIAARKHLEHRP